MMLGFHVFLCLCEDLYGFILMRPIVFLPVVGIYADGLLSNIFHINPFIQIVGFFLLIHINAGVILHICLFRLKVIIPISFKCYSLVVKSGKWFIALMYFFCITSTSIFLLLLEDQNEAKFYISQTVSPLPTMFWSDKYVVSTAKSKNFYRFLYTCLCFVVSNISMCSCVVLTAFGVLYRTKSNISAKVVEAQKVLLKVLIIQNFDINPIEQEEFISKCSFIMEIRTILTLPFYILALLCIFMKSQNFQKHYKTMLAVHVFFCLIEDIYGFIFMRPAVFPPVIGVYTDGILSNIFNIHPYIQVVGFFLIIHLNAGVILHISFHRLKIVIPMSFRFYNLMITKGKWFLVLMYIYCMLSMSAFGLLIENQEEAKIYISQVIVVIVFLIIPFTAFGINIKYDLQSLTLLISSIVLTISHGSISTLTLMLSTKSYRQEFARIFGKCKCFPCTNRHLLHNNVISSIR
ncbi:unnamed protein product [Caenorhabditis angaria]|uniref:Serpentine Receptor, class H n=1 Tax=Caenorhabditis angaria TaxID=860376 RepID=A0A9P1N6C4_9PELO|nr:unnamed protein product [Caenorhabditis angaria]